MEFIFATSVTNDPNELLSLCGQGEFYNSKTLQNTSNYYNKNFTHKLSNYLSNV